MSARAIRQGIGVLVGLAVLAGAYAFFEAQKKKNIEQKRYGAHGARIAELRSLAQADVCNKAVARELATLLERVEQLPEAAGALVPAIENCPFDGDLIERSARLWRRAGRLDRALVEAERLVKERPTEAGGYAVRAAIQSDIGRTSAAIADYRQVWELAPGDEEAARALARVLEDGGDACGAADILDQMLARRKPVDANRLRTRSDRLRSDGRCPRERVEGGRAIVPFQLDSDVMLVKVRINDRVDATMVLDTGASSVTLTRRFAERLGVSASDGEPYYVSTAGGATVAYRIMLDQMSLGAARVKRVGAAIVPNMNLGPEIDGLLGNTFLSHFRVRVESREGHIVLETLQ